MKLARVVEPFHLQFEEVQVKQPPDVSYARGIVSIFNT